VTAIPSGGYRVDQHAVKQPASDDHTAPRLALMRLAALQALQGPIEMRIRYLATGEEKAVPAQPRYEPARIGKYATALIGITAGDFRAAESRECARCAYFVICPV